MLCEECKKNNATTHIKNMVNGKIEELYLCEECSTKNDDFNFESGFSIHSFLSSLLEGNISPNWNVNYEQHIKCPQCESTYSDFKKSGRLGCDMCYASHRQMLLPLIRRIQGNSVHGGKIPKRSGEVVRRRREVMQLKDTLQQLVTLEEFEKAADIRDQIKRLESEEDGI